MSTPLSETAGRLRRWLPVLLVLASWPAAARAGDDGAALVPEPGQGRTATAMLRILERQHYRGVSVDDGFSEDVLSRYLDVLDPSHASLLVGDVAEFERLYGRRLDDALRGGDLRPAFRIFARFRKRLKTQIEYYRGAVAAGIDRLRFDTLETLELDRRHAPWPEDEAAARELWRKRFKNDVLGLKLEGRDDEEIEAALERRYANQLRRLEQTRARDVFSLFVNVVTGAFDPHTSYFPPLEAENFDMMMSLSFQGIGAELTTDGEYATVARLIPGGPAEKSGQVHATDRIVAVGQGEDGELVDVVGLRLDEIVDLIRGPAGTVVRLALRSAESVDGSRVVTLERAQVQLEEQAASSRVIEVEVDGRTTKVGVIDLPAFYLDFEGARSGAEDYRSSARDVARLVRELRDQGVAGIVMDLRGNGGGSLTEVQAMSGLFLGPGPVVQVRDAVGRVNVLGSEEKALYDGPLVVLVDRMSASASEIFAAAIQDRGRGLIVGTRTFGKGTVQAVVPLDEGQLKLTQAKFYRVSGGSTQDRGVTPDIEFPSRFDPDELGESALPGALPWDRIRPAVKRADGFLRRITPELARLFRERAAGEPEFVRDFRLYRASEEMRARTSVTLVEADRRADVRRDEERLLAIENDWRAAAGLPPAKDLAQARAERPTGGPDVFVREAARILVDLERADRVVRAPLPPR